MCHHPFLFAHLPLSYPTTTLKVMLIIWGSYCWGVECGRTISPFPHAHSTSRLTLMMAEKPLPHHSRQTLHYSIRSTTAWDIFSHSPKLVDKMQGRSASSHTVQTSLWWFLAQRGRGVPFWTLAFGVGACNFPYGGGRCVCSFPGTS